MTQGGTLQVAVFSKEGTVCVKNMEAELLWLPCSSKFNVQEATCF